MAFIGIIANKLDFEFIKEEILKNSTYSNLKLFNLNKNNIQNMKNIKFETIVICVDAKEIILDDIIKGTKYLIINSDLNVLPNVHENDNLQVITYGMGRKATVTTSSVNEDEVMICLQRNMENIDGRIIEMQEFKVNAEDITNDKVYNLLVVFVLIILHYPHSNDF